MPPKVNMNNFNWKFYLDYYPEIRRRGIKTEKQAREHYKHYGAKENRLKNANEIIENFDWKFYVSYYQDIKKKGIKTEKHALEHYRKSGMYEGRVKNEKEIATNLSKSNKIICNYNSFNVTTNDEEYINICIRTSNRPEYFNLCIKSILEQNYKNFNIIIAYDKKESLLYLNKYTHLNNVNVFFPEVESTQKYKFNLYCNKMMDKVKRGWIMFLDDDDQLTHKNSLKIINENIKKNNNNVNSFLIWKFLRPDKIIYPENPNNIKLGEIDTTCFLFNSKWKDIARWTDKQCGDYNFVKEYIEKSTIKPQFIMMNCILTKTTDEYAGCHFGLTTTLISITEDEKITIKQEKFFLNYVINYKYIFCEYTLKQKLLKYISCFLC